MISLESLISFYDNFGYLGIFIISFIGSILVFIPVPYFPVLITSAFNDNLNPHLISLSSALGAALAKLAIFFISYYGRKILSENAKKRMLPLQKLLRKYGWFGAFIAAATPIPDDIIYIPLGLTRYKPWKFFTATIAGKFTFNEIVVLGSVYLGRPFIENASAGSNNPVFSIVGAIITIALIIITIYVSIRIDWNKLIGKWFPSLLDKDENSKEK